MASYKEETALCDNFLNEKTQKREFEKVCTFSIRLPKTSLIIVLFVAGQAYTWYMYMPNNAAHLAILSARGKTPMMLLWQFLDPCLSYVSMYYKKERLLVA